MATATQLKALIQSHAERDDARFFAVAMQVAALEARQGHGTVAEELRSLIDAAKSRAPSTAPLRRTPLGPVAHDLADLLSFTTPSTKLVDMTLADEVRDRLERVLREQRQAYRLRERGLGPRRKILLMGPPGSGKTMTAAALAGELTLPLVTVVLEGLITKFLGEIAAKLRIIFEAMNHTSGVYLFDEFDAIGRQRAATNDVGEIRRVLSSFLLLLEKDASPGLIVAATNNPSLLDPALFRRFDDVIEYQPPTKELIRALMENRLATFPTEALDWARVVGAASGLSSADVVRSCEDAAKAMVLANEAAITTRAILTAFEERRPRADRS
ncbi:ATP-binding protein [bacterium]|nr:ATP-binding protein [bacterium]